MNSIQSNVNNHFTELLGICNFRLFFMNMNLVLSAFGFPLDFNRLYTCFTKGRHVILLSNHCSHENNGKKYNSADGKSNNLWSLAREEHDEKFENLKRACATLLASNIIVRLF